MAKAGEAEVDRARVGELKSVDRRAGELERPSSPCIKVCELDPTGYCRGCLRTGDEIGRWISMSAAEQWALVAELALRRQID